MTMGHFQRGIRENRGQVAHQLIQVLLVGFALGMTRTVVPALAESEFGLSRGSFLLLASFVVAFGAVKAVMNFVAGRWSERIGRKQVLAVGWVVALPIPVMIWYAPDWNWIVAATVLLGVNQGLCWSTTVIMKIDLVGPERRAGEGCGHDGRSSLTGWRARRAACRQFRRCGGARPRRAAR